MTATDNSKTPPARSTGSPLVPLTIAGISTARHEAEGHSFGVRISSEPTLALVEIFKSLQGEGLNAGLPYVFVRFALCNLQCDFCDTNFNKINVRTNMKGLLELLKLYEGTPWVCFTGGEPMLQLRADLVLAVKEALKCKVACETNGMIWSDAFRHIDHVVVSPKVAHSSPDKPIPPEKQLAPQLVQAVRDGEVRVAEMRYLVCGPQDTPVIHDLKCDSIIFSPLFVDSSITSEWQPGLGHQISSSYPHLPAVRRAMELVNMYADRNARLSLQMHKIARLK